MATRDSVNITVGLAGYKSWICRCFIMKGVTFTTWHTSLIRLL